MHDVHNVSCSIKDIVLVSPFCFFYGIFTVLHYMYAFACHDMRLNVTETVWVGSYSCLNLPESEGHIDGLHSKEHT